MDNKGLNKKITQKKKAKKKTTKNTQGKGRPTLYDDRLKNIMIKLFAEGKTNEQVCDLVGISLRSLYTWKEQYKDFSHAIKESKNITDDIVEATLLQKAMGYSHDEEKIFCSEGDIITHQTTKQYPPDTASIIFWLKNRQPERWREKLDSEKDNLNITIDLADKVAKARERAKKAKT